MNTTLHNGVILSTLSISSHGFAFGFSKRLHTNREINWWPFPKWTDVGHFHPTERFPQLDRWGWDRDYIPRPRPQLVSFLSRFKKNNQYNKIPRESVPISALQSRKNK